MTRDEFEERFPDWEWLESQRGCTRLSNGLGEGSDWESAWFCDHCDELVEDPWFAGCDCGGEE